jgi:hypothetical protein
MLTAADIRMLERHCAMKEGSLMGSPLASRYSMSSITQPSQLGTVVISSPKVIPAVLTSQGLVPRDYRWFRALHKSGLARYVALEPDDPLFGERVARFFECNGWNWRLVHLGFNALLADASVGLEILEAGPLMPRPMPHFDLVAFELAWARLRSHATVGDRLLVYEPKEWLDRVIAGVDGGVWSHAAFVLDQDTLIDTTFEGRLVTPLTKYKDPNTTVGLYRPIDKIRRQILSDPDAYTARLKNECGRGYPYWWAALCGLRAYLNIQRGGPTPNGLIYRGQVTCVAWACGL